jgi:hypothetical protein
MRPLLVLIALIFFTAIPSKATIRTVSNDPQNPAQFNTIQAAVNAAVAGDTIYVNASSTRYSENVQVTKQLVLIGGGYKSPLQLNYVTEVSGLFFPFFGANNPSGSVVCGFLVGTISSFSAGSSPISNIQIFRNSVGTISVYGSNWMIYNNIITSTLSLTTNPISNTFIQNNIFSGGFITGNSSIGSSILIDHNIFLRGSGQSLNNVYYSTITNNLFLQGSASAYIIDNGTKLNNFNNNLCLLANSVSNLSPFNSFSIGPNTEAGNFVGVDPLLINVTNFSLYDFNANYRLQATSPVRNAATDGTDLGIYGGSYPFPSGGSPGGGFDTSALPPIPQVNSVNIQNGTLAPGAQLKVTIQATVNN